MKRKNESQHATNASSGNYIKFHFPGDTIHDCMRSTKMLANLLPKKLQAHASQEEREADVTQEDILSDTQRAALQGKLTRTKEDLGKDVGRQHRYASNNAIAEEITNVMRGDFLDQLDEKYAASDQFFYAQGVFTGGMYPLNSIEEFNPDSQEYATRNKLGAVMASAVGSADSGYFKSEENHYGGFYMINQWLKDNPAVGSMMDNENINEEDVREVNEAFMNILVIPQFDANLKRIGVTVVMKANDKHTKEKNWITAESLFDLNKVKAKQEELAQAGQPQITQETLTAVGVRETVLPLMGEDNRRLAARVSEKFLDNEEGLKEKIKPRAGIYLMSDLEIEPDVLFSYEGPLLREKIIQQQRNTQAADKDPLTWMRLKRFAFVYNELLRGEKSRTVSRPEVRSLIAKINELPENTDKKLLEAYADKVEELGNRGGGRTRTGVVWDGVMNNDKFDAIKSNYQKVSCFDKLLNLFTCRSLNSASLNLGKQQQQQQPSAEKTDEGINKPGNDNNKPSGNDKDNKPDDKDGLVL